MCLSELANYHKFIPKNRPDAVQIQQPPRPVPKASEYPLKNDVDNMEKVWRRKALSRNF